MFFWHYVNTFKNSSRIQVIISVMTTLTLTNPHAYNTTIFINGEEYKFDNSYKVYLTDESFGKLNIVYEPNIEDYMVNAEFNKTGKTDIVLESPAGEPTIYEIVIQSHNYEITKK